MFSQNADNDKPCRHMQGLVSALADGALTGIAKWFTVHHVAGCSRCRHGLTYFQALKVRLRAVGEAEASLTPERRAATEAAWEQADQEQATLHS